MQRCPGCGYSYAATARGEIAGELRAFAARHGTVLGHADTQKLRIHPAPGVWSALEYGCHVRDVHLVQRERVRRALAEEEPDFAPMRREERVVEDRYNEQDPRRVADELAAAADALALTLEALDEAGWARTGIYHWPTTAPRSVEWIGRHTVHESVHHLGDVEAALGARSPAAADRGAKPSRAENAEHRT